MTKNPRRKIIEFEPRFLREPRDPHPNGWNAILECGHFQPVVGEFYLPRFKACWECGNADRSK
jgi:hypothetical protein